MNKFNLDVSRQILKKTPEVLNSLLSDLPEIWINATEGGESWSSFDIVGHLVHGEKTDWLMRIKIILEHQTEKQFEPFDRFAQLKDSDGKTIAQLLNEFENLRRENLRQLDLLDLSAEQLKLEGRHPALGIVTLEQLLAAWVVHDLGHIRQIARILAKNYQSEIGVWREYLPVVDE